MNEETTARETKSHTLSAAISNLDESIAKLRALRNEIGFNQDEKEPGTAPEQVIDSLSLLLERGSDKINNQSSEITELVEQIRELLF